LGAFGGTLWFGPEWRGIGLLVGEAAALRHDGPTFDGMDRVTVEGSQLRLSGLRHDGRTRFTVSVSAAAACTIIGRGEIALEAGRISLAAPRAGCLRGLPKFADDPMTEALRAAQSDLGVASLADAEFIIDVGYGVGSRDGLELVVEPLKAGLERLGVKKVMVGASRKVTLDLGILPDELQIGQTGVSVNPKVVLALGISGAPQHMNYIGERAVIFAFNRDPEAPIFAFNRSRPKPHVLPVPGDLFAEVPRFLRALEAAVAVPV
jgi:electron transfer flavoprotein alpha subunit